MLYPSLPCVTSDTPFTTASSGGGSFIFGILETLCAPPMKSCANVPSCVCSLPSFCVFGALLLRQGLVGPLPALPEAALTYLFETKLAVASFHGCGYRPKVAALFGSLFVHVNCRTKVNTEKEKVAPSWCSFFDPLFFVQGFGTSMLRQDAGEK